MARTENKTLQPGAKFWLAGCCKMIGAKAERLSERLINPALVVVTKNPAALFGCLQDSPGAGGGRLAVAIAKGDVQKAGLGIDRTLQ